MLGVNPPCASKCVSKNDMQSRKKLNPINVKNKDAALIPLWTLILRWNVKTNTYTCSSQFVVREKQKISEKQKKNTIICSVEKATIPGEVSAAF